MIDALLAHDAAQNNGYLTIVRFLYHEAELLDDGRLRDWLGLFTEDVDYRVPTRSTRHRGVGSEFSAESYYLIDTHRSLATRIARFETAFAFSEDPPARSRRIVGNVRIVDGSFDGGAIGVKSNLLLFRARHDGESRLLAAERHDVFQTTDAGLRIASRLVLLDHTTFPMENLSFFL